MERTHSPFFSFFIPVWTISISFVYTYFLIQVSCDYKDFFWNFYNIHFILVLFYFRNVFYKVWQFPKILYQVLKNKKDKILRLTLYNFVLVETLIKRSVTYEEKLFGLRQKRDLFVLFYPLDRRSLPFCFWSCLTTFFVVVFLHYGCFSLDFI